MVAVGSLQSAVTTTTPAPPPIDVTYYGLNVAVDPIAQRVSGTVTIGARITAPHTDSIRLDLSDSMTVSSVRVDGNAAGFTHGEDALTIAAPRSSGDRVRIVIAYDGHPVGDGFTFAGDSAHPRVSTYGLPYTAHEWWPCRDTPADKADSADIVVTVPAPLVVASNGRLVSRTSNAVGTTTFHWAVRYPIYPDVMSLAIADYATFTLYHREASGDLLPMTFYAFREDSAKAAADFSVLPAILDFYESIYGAYPFAREKYGVAEFATRSFREHQTIPSYGAPLITGDHRNDGVLAHELAHQWFGNSLSVANWSDVWLNESLAQYSSLLWREDVRGRAAYDSVVAAIAARNIKGTLYVPDSVNLGAMFGPVTFQKGALALARLRETMGDSAFFGGLREYAAAHAYGNVSTADFERAMERAYGKPLGAFFDEWVYGPAGAAGR